ncbi:uncharacterized protein UV8b_02596 [Ustilaginoidea virens]|uniref:Uncharacterized protein n=1 Tax=Ustilaginoidea virens TaxID=1159556 RepID=A0A8E5HMS6_USTVR|nr:uncharacterized protein UV8b_02596 [Ustilaginoidea virens]QUC18355.1 hypothetical protein UV8b_02596 [Ustilaginoidea virens]
MPPATAVASLTMYTVFWNYFQVSSLPLFGAWKLYGPSTHRGTGVPATRSILLWLLPPALTHIAPALVELACTMSETPLWPAFCGLNPSSQRLTPRQWSIYELIAFWAI